MTDAEKDAEWRSLPEGFKRQLRCDYATAESAHSLDPTNVRIEAHKKFLEMYFGKHNLTATEDEKPRFKVGDKVVYVGCNKDWIGSRFVIDGDIFYNDYFKCLMASSISCDDTHIGNVPLSDLTPYTEEQEPPLKVTAAESLIQMAKDEMGIVNDDTPKSDTPDWLAYRMELAKEVVKVVYHHKTPHKDIIDDTMQIVDGIVERLKGGVNGKV